MWKWQGELCAPEVGSGYQKRTFDGNGQGLLLFFDCISTLCRAGSRGINALHFDGNLALIYSELVMSNWPQNIRNRWLTRDSKHIRLSVS